MTESLLDKFAPSIVGLALATGLVGLWIYMGAPGSRSASDQLKHDCIDLYISFSAADTSATLALMDARTELHSPEGESPDHSKISALKADYLKLTEKMMENREKTVSKRAEYEQIMQESEETPDPEVCSTEDMNIPRAWSLSLDG